MKYSKLENLKKQLANKHKGSVYNENEEEELSNLENEEKNAILDKGDRNKETEKLMNKLHTSIQQIEMYGIRASVQLKNNAEKSKMKLERGLLISKNLKKPENKNSQYDISVFAKKNELNIEKTNEKEKERENKLVFHPNKFDYFVKQKQKKFKGEFAIKDEEMRDKIYELSENGHFGPYTSFCKNCNKKNINFYNFIERKTGVSILDNMLHPRKLK